MNKTLKKTLAWLLGLLILLSTGGCVSSPQTPTTKIRLTEVVHSVFYAPQYIAINQGFFQEENLEIELTTGWGGDKAMTALVAGQSDIALIGPETTIYLHQQGSDKKVMTFAQLTQTDGSFLLGRPSAAPFAWSDLKGKTIIGGRPGGVPEMVLEWVLKEHGLQPDQDVNIIKNLQFTATAGAFKGGTGDYIALFEPTASALEKTGDGQVIDSLGKAGGKITYTVYMASDAYINGNPQIIEGFTRAIYKAQRWIASHSVEEITAAIAPSFPDDDLEIIKKSVERYKKQDTWAPNPITQADGFDHLQEIMVSAGELKAKVPFEQLVNTTIAEKVVREASN